MSAETPSTSKPKIPYGLIAVGGIIFAAICIMTVVFLTRPVPLTDTQAAKTELVNRVEKVFAQKFSVTGDAVVVDLGTEDSLTQYENQEAQEVTVVVAATGDEAAAFLAETSGLQKSWVTVSGGLMKIGAGFEVPLLGNLNAGVSQTVSSGDGKLTLAPEGFYLSGLRVPASELLGIPVVGDWVKQFTSTQTHCIVNRVPNGFEMTQATVNGAQLQMTFVGSKVPLTLEKLQETGVCS